MKKIIPFLVLLTILFSCKNEIVKKPNRLIEKEKMVNVMYDLSILEAIRNQNPNSLETRKINPTEYIYKKHKIDSIQFVQSNAYYASDYKEYKLMYDQVKSRLDKRKSSVESLVKIESKKSKARKIAEGKLKAKKVADSIKKAKKEIKIKKESDSIKKIKELKVAKIIDSIKKAKKKKKTL